MGGGSAGFAISYGGASTATQTIDSRHGAPAVLQAPARPTLQGERRWHAARWALFALGLLIALVMVARSQVEGDQLDLLMLGWGFATGDWVPFGNPTSNGGHVPGALTALVIGAPMRLWMDHRAPALLVLATHVVAYLLLDRVIARTLGTRARLLLAVFYWLGPWRLFLSAFVWNPGFLHIAGAVHLWSCYRQRDRARFWPTTILVTTIGLVAQLNLSVSVLAFAAGLLWLRGYVRLHWLGIAAGTAITLMTLVPWFVAIAEDPALIPHGRTGFFGRGIITVFPLLKGLLYWLRTASLWCSERMMLRFDFTPAFGAAADTVLTPAFLVLGYGIGPLTAAVPLLANVRLWRRRGLFGGLGRFRGGSGRAWIQGYTAWCFAAAVLAYATSPITVMMWQTAPLVHVAVLPAVIFGASCLRAPWRPRAMVGLRVYVGLSVLLCLGMAFGSSMYRRGGRDAARCTSDGRLGMAHDLKLTERASVTIDPSRKPGVIAEWIARRRQQPPGAK